MAEAVIAKRHRDAVVVFGQQVPVEEVEGASLVTRFSGEEMIELLELAGMEDALAQVTAGKMLKAGSHMPSAWAQVERSELISAGVGAGYLNSIIGVFQRRSLEVCGTTFARVMGGPEKSDA